MRCSLLLLGLLLLSQTASATNMDASDIGLEGERHCLVRSHLQQAICLYQYNPQGKQTVVLIHGLNGSARDDWAGQIALLAEHYQVLTIELPGFDDPSKLPAHYSTKYFAEVVHQLTREFATRPFTLIGHSMGGVVALHYAIEHPGSLDRMVLVSVPGVLHQMAYSREVIGSWVRGGGGGHGGLSARVEKLGIKLLSTLEGLTGRRFESTDFILPQLSDNPQAMAAVQLATQDFSRVLQRINLPVLLLWGENDRIAPPRIGYTLRARLPNARLHVFADTAHMPMQQARHRFNQFLVEFLIARSWPLEASARIEPAGLDGDEGRVGRCRNQNDMVFAGVYEHIDIRSCEGVVIRNARIGSLTLDGARVEILDSLIGREQSGVAVRSLRSDLKITGTRLIGPRTLESSGSRIDMAGVSLMGSGATAQIWIERGSDLLFSMSEIRIGEQNVALHGYYGLEQGELLPLRWE